MKSIYVFSLALYVSAVVCGKRTCTEDRPVDIENIRNVSLACSADTAAPPPQSPAPSGNREVTVFGRLVQGDSCAPTVGAQVLVQVRSLGESTKQTNKSPSLLPSAPLCRQVLVTNAHGYFRLNVQLQNTDDVLLQFTLPDGQDIRFCSGAGSNLRLPCAVALKSDVQQQEIYHEFMMTPLAPRVNSVNARNKRAIYLKLEQLPEVLDENAYIEDMDSDKRSWGDADINWLRKRSSTKRTWGDSGMDWMKRDWSGESNWLKRGWASEDMPWLRKRTVYPLAAPLWQSSNADMGQSLLSGYPLNRRSWADADMHWIRKRRDVAATIRRRRATDGSDSLAVSASDDLSGEEEKRSWGDANMAWIKRDSAADEKAKKSWGDSGMAWIKRDGEDKEKKSWGDSGMAWIKRGGDDDFDEDKRSWGDSGMAWIKRSPDDKRAWSDAGMAWMKRNPDDKRSWSDGGMAWIKRDDDDGVKRSWGDSGMAWIKRDPSDKRSWGDSGMAWIKRDPSDKRSWGDSGMAWIKRDPSDKRSWGDSGMAWIKRNPKDEGKRSWGDSGMSWIKRAPVHLENGPAEARRSLGDSGMAWIKRNGFDKKSWGDSGMAWIKRDHSDAVAEFRTHEKRSDSAWIKKNWAGSDMQWMKRGVSDGENNKEVVED